MSILAETIMSKNLIINTPLPILVGKKTYALITFEDLYRKCLKDPALLPALAEVPGDLPDVLAERKMVLPEKCARQLMKMLKDKRLVALVLKYLKEGKPWPSESMHFWGNPRSRLFRATCTWPDCPSD